MSDETKPTPKGAVSANLPPRHPPTTTATSATPADGGSESVAVPVALPPGYTIGTLMIDPKPAEDVPGIVRHTVYRRAVRIGNGVSAVGTGWTPHEATAEAVHESWCWYYKNHPRGILAAVQEAMHPPRRATLHDVADTLNLPRASTYTNARVGDMAVSLEFDMSGAAENMARSLSKTLRDTTNKLREVVADHTRTVMEAATRARVMVPPEPPAPSERPVESFAMLAAAAVEQFVYLTNQIDGPLCSRFTSRIDTGLTGTTRRGRSMYDSAENYYV